MRIYNTTVSDDTISFSRIIQLLLYWYPHNDDNNNTSEKVLCKLVVVVVETYSGTLTILLLGPEGVRVSEIYGLAEL